MNSQLILNRILFNKKYNERCCLAVAIYRPLLFGQKVNRNSSSHRNIVFTNSNKKIHHSNEAAVNLFEQVRRTYMKGGPGYTKFGHGRPKYNLSKFAYFWYTLLFTGFMFAAFFNFETFMFDGEDPIEKLEYTKLRGENKPKAKEIKNKSSSSSSSKSDSDEEEKDEDSDKDEKKQIDKKQKNKSKLTFRERKIIQYENRIRQYSTPDKVFRYFSTIKVWNQHADDYEIYMTPDDFVRSFTYGIRQPDGLGLDSYNKFDPNMQKLEINLSDDSIFKCLGQNGLISFSDFIFLTTLLSTPVRHFQIAFHMFDADGNGNIDHEEFEELQGIIRNQTSIGQRHRDTRMTGSVLKGNKNLNEYFFGKDNGELLTVDKFVDFQRKLQAEVMKKEFELCQQQKQQHQTSTADDNNKQQQLKQQKLQEEATISELDFCEIILAYAGMESAKTKKMLKNVAKLYGSGTGNHHDYKGITFKDYESFFEILRSIHDIDTALKFYSIAGAPIDKKILKHVAKTVAGVHLSDHVLDVVFSLFDENGDGKLSHKEFIKVMKKRSTRGLQMPKDTGFVKFIQAFGTCLKETIISSSS